MQRASSALPSFADPTWRALLRGYLDGEPHITKVLGDWCADREIQNIRPGALDQRVRYVLGTIPPERAHALVCDFVEHPLAEQGTIDRRIDAVLRAKRRWLAGEIGDSTLREARHNVRVISSRVYGAAAAEQAAAESPAPSVAQRTSLLAAYLRRGGANSFLDETRWQISQLHRLLGS